MYSYDEQGQPKWQIASGQFDENGLFSAALLTPEGGTAIESQSPVSAEFSDQVQTLEIQLQGTELATFSIDGSAPKNIQNYNFGASLYQTENYTVNQQPIQFPDLIGYWVGVDYSNDNIGSNLIYMGEYSAVVSPRPPGGGLLYGSDSLSSVPLFDFIVSFTCTRELFEYNSLSYCDGYYSNTSDDMTGNDNLRFRVYYQDIGFKQFYIYVDDEGDLNRESRQIAFFRLDALWIWN